MSNTAAEIRAYADATGVSVPAKATKAEMLEAFIRLYYDDLYRESGPVDPVEFEAYWPELKTPADLIPYTGTEVYLYALADAVYGRDKATGDYGSLHVPLCVILKLNCPWEEEHGWAAVFIEETT